ncbi:MAG: site-specific integrase [Verrucomicrobia bacterium]|nr:site-specific integrase [Verrucomicrobiota bacterium]
MEGDAWDQWVDAWIKLRFGDSPANTFDRYRRSWVKLEKWLSDIQVTRPAQLTYQLCQGYVGWRAQHGGKKNTAIGELKFLGQIMDEAIKRGYCATNPARKMGLRKTAPPDKAEWQENEIKLVMETLEREMFGSWLHVTFLMGLYQAARLRQCAVPLDRIDFERGVITYPADVVKGGKAFAQPIVPQLRERLLSIVNERRRRGERFLCTIPERPSIEWRVFLDSLGLRHVSHHGLRVTFITRACRARVPENQVMRFVSHSSTAVHRIYQKLSVGDIAEMLSLVPLPDAPHEGHARTLPSGATF